MLQPSKDKDGDTHFRLSCLAFGFMLCDQCDEGKLIGVIVAFPSNDAIQISFENYIQFRKFKKQFIKNVH